MKKKFLLLISFLFFLILAFWLGRNKYDGEREVRAQAGTWEGVYGVEYANSEDFPELASRGVRTILTQVSASQATWESFYSAAVANNIKLVPVLGWSNGQPLWSWNSAANEWELDINKYSSSIGAQFLNFLRTHPDYLDHTFAVYAFHEPNNVYPVPASRMQKFWQQIHNEEFPSGQLKTYGESISWSNGCHNGCVDYDHITLYSFANCGDGGKYRLHVAGVTYGSCTSDEAATIASAKTKIDWYYNLVRGASPAPDGSYTKHIVLIQTLAHSNFSDIWNRMPEAWEMYDWGTQIITQRKDKVAGMFWYPYRFGPLYSQTLYNSRYDTSGADRWQVINDVAEVLFAGVRPTATPTPPVSLTSTPTPTSTVGPSPTSTPTPSIKDPDVNNDGQVNAQDMIQLLVAWGAIDPNGPEDLDSDGRVNSLDAGRIVAEWTGGPAASPTPTPSLGTPTGLDIYGVRFAGSEDYQELASLGVMHPATVVSNNSQVDSVINAIRTTRISYPDFKPSLVFYSGGWPFTCTGVTDAGMQFITHMNHNNYWDDIMAINGLHEPLGSIACSSLSQIQAVVSQIKQLSDGQAMIFDKLYSDTSYRDMGFADGICDYCAVLYHPYRGNTSGTFNKDTLLVNLERDMSLIKSLPPGETLNKFIPWLCTIHYPGVYGTGVYMPSPSEMLDGGSSIINFTSSQGYQANGFLWYTWGNNAGWIGLDQYNDDGQRAGRMEVISAVAELR